MNDLVKGAMPTFDNIEVSAKTYNFVSKIEDAFVMVRKTLGVWIKRHNDRKVLYRLSQDQHMLDDIGLSYFDIQREMNKPFWKI